MIAYVYWPSIAPTQPHGAADLYAAYEHHRARARLLRHLDTLQRKAEQLMETK